MSRKLKGFSLAELLISLLVISIVLSAAIPTITKRTSQDRDQIWKWSTDNNSTYFGLGSQQSVLIGTPTVPTGDITVLMDEDNKSDTNNYSELYIDQPRFTTAGDKLAILKQSLHGQTTNMANSHISFYTIESGAERTASNIVYEGRIATDNHNLAFGKGTLLHQRDIATDWLGENTAIGHYTLMSNVDGIRNVAVGEKALSNNRDGYSNTAVGFLAANKIGRAPSSHDRSDRGARTVQNMSIDEVDLHGGLSSSNTAVGYNALGSNITGYGNTAVGSVSSGATINGDDNTSIGSFALQTLDQGYGNSAVGANACSSLKTGNYNICIGNAVLSEKAKDNFSLAIGSTPTPKKQDVADGSSDFSYDLNTATTIEQYKERIPYSVPLITGHTQMQGDFTAPTADKKLFVNARYVGFKPFNGGNYPTFLFTSVPGELYDPAQTGYGYKDNISRNKTSAISGSAYFNLKYVPGSTKSDSVTMQIHAVDNHAVIGTFNSNKIYKGATKNDSKVAYKDISFNQVLRLDMPFKFVQGEHNPLNNMVAHPDVPYPSGFVDHSNIIDPSASGLIRSYKEKVGLVGEFVNRQDLKNAYMSTGAKPSDAAYYNTFDLLLNSKVNISRVAAHVFNIDEYGTQIIGTGNKPFEVILDGNTKQPNLKVDKDITAFKIPTNGIWFYNPDGSGSTTNYIFKISNEHIEAHRDIWIEGLRITAGFGDESLIGALKTLKDAIDNVRNQISDARLKNISGDSTAGLAEINKLEVKNYTYKNDEKKTPHVGVIAQQLQKVFPDAVTTHKDGYLRIRTEDIFYAMVNSIKELCAKLQDLTAKVVGLDKRITELEAQNKMLLEQNKAFEKRLEKLEKQAAK